jgi:hypothetical protein
MQKKDPASLLRVYITHNLVELAVDFAVELIDAYFVPNQHFDIAVLHRGITMAGSAWLPLTALDLLRARLREQCRLPLLERLETSISKYNKAV